MIIKVKLALFLSLVFLITCTSNTDTQKNSNAVPKEGTAPPLIKEEGSSIENEGKPTKAVAVKNEPEGIPAATKEKPAEIISIEKTKPTAIKNEKPTQVISIEKTPSLPSSPKQATEKTKEEIKIVEAEKKPLEKNKTIPNEAPVSAPITTAPPKKKTTTEREVLNIQKEKPLSLSTIHSLWDELLQKYVSKQGKVDYKGLKRDNRLSDYSQKLQENLVQDTWSRSEKMAYWINVYNAFTIQLIVDNYPISSITKLYGGKPWDHQWIRLGDKTYSLNKIEHEILRAQFKDARIHFAINCAASSCPPILNQAWTASNLERNLARQTKLFINNPAYNGIGNNKLELSKIFEWYQEDFGDLIEYINQYSTTKARAGAAIQFKDYDWALNE